MRLTAIDDHSASFSQGAKITNLQAGGGLQVIFLELEGHYRQVTFFLQIYNGLLNPSPIFTWCRAAAFVSCPCHQWTIRVTSYKSEFVTVMFNFEGRFGTFLVRAASIPLHAILTIKIQ